MDNQNQNVITATRIDDAMEQRMFFQKYFRASYMPKAYVKQQIFPLDDYFHAFLGGMCSEDIRYQGVNEWSYHELSNGGFYTAPMLDQPLRVQWSLNYFDIEISADAAGIITTLYILGIFAEATMDVYYADMHHKLLDYVTFHPEKEHIFAAID